MALCSVFFSICLHWFVFYVFNGLNSHVNKASYCKLKWGRCRYVKIFLDHRSALEQPPDNFRERCHFNDIMTTCCAGHQQRRHTDVPGGQMSLRSPISPPHFTPIRHSSLQAGFSLPGRRRPIRNYAKLDPILSAASKTWHVGGES